MDKGPSVDPVTLRPVAQASNKDLSSTDQAERQRLVKKIEDLSLSASAEGQKVIKMIQDKLFTRINEVLRSDPESKAYLQILTEIGVRHCQAKRALDVLCSKSLGNEIVDNL